MARNSVSEIMGDVARLFTESTDKEKVDAIRKVLLDGMPPIKAYAWTLAITCPEVIFECIRRCDGMTEGVMFEASDFDYKPATI